MSHLITNHELVVWRETIYEKSLIFFTQQIRYPNINHRYVTRSQTISMLLKHWQPHNNQVASIFFPLQSWEPQHQFQERTTVVEPLRLRVFYTIVVLFSSSFSSVSPIKVTTLIIDDHYNALQAFLNNAASNPTTLISPQN